MSLFGAGWLNVSTVKTKRQEEEQEWDEIFEILCVGDVSKRRINSFQTQTETFIYNNHHHILHPRISLISCIDFPGFLTNECPNFSPFYQSHISQYCHPFCKALYTLKTSSLPSWRWCIREQVGSSNILTFEPSLICKAAKFTHPFLLLVCPPTLIHNLLYYCSTWMQISDVGTSLGLITPE